MVSLYIVYLIYISSFSCGCVNTLLLTFHKMTICPTGNKSRLYNHLFQPRKDPSVRASHWRASIIRSVFTFGM